MASISRASQTAVRNLGPWLGLGSPKRSASGPIREEGSRIDQLEPKEMPPESPTHDGTWSRTLRSMASMLYVREEKEHEAVDSPSPPMTPAQTPARSSLRSLTWSRSSRRSRTYDTSPTRKSLVMNDDGSAPLPKSDEMAPFLDIDIPNPSLDSNRPSTEEQKPLDITVHVPLKSTRIIFAQDGLPCASEPTKCCNQYQRETRLDLGEDKGYASDIESNNELEPPLEMPTKASSRAVEPLSKKAKSTRIASMSPAKGRNPLNLKRSFDILRSKIASSFRSSEKEAADRAASNPYDADAEFSESSPPAPSMGSREDWDYSRVERNKRFFQAMNDEALTESDEGIDSRPQIPANPLRFATEAIERVCGDQLKDNDPIDAHDSTAATPLHSISETPFILRSRSQLRRPSSIVSAGRNGSLDEFEAASFDKDVTKQFAEMPLMPVSVSTCLGGQCDYPLDVIEAGGTMAALEPEQPIMSRIEEAIRPTERAISQPTALDDLWSCSNCLPSRIKDQSQGLPESESQGHSPRLGNISETFDDSDTLSCRSEQNQNSLPSLEHLKVDNFSCSPFYSQAEEAQLHTEANLDDDRFSMSDADEIGMFRDGCFVSKKEMSQALELGETANCSDSHEEIKEDSDVSPKRQSKTMMVRGDKISPHANRPESTSPAQPNPSLQPSASKGNVGPKTPKNDGKCNSDQSPSSQEIDRIIRHMNHGIAKAFGAAHDVDSDDSKNASDGGVYVFDVISIN